MHSEAVRAAQLAWDAMMSAAATHAGAGVQALARALHAASTPWVEAAGVLEIRRAGPFLLVNGVRVGGAPVQRARVRRAVELLRSTGLEGLRITPGVSLAEVETWVELALEPALASHAAGGVVVQLRAAGVRHIEAMVALPAQRRAAAPLPVHRQQAFSAYAAALTAQRAFTAITAHAEPTLLHPLRRSVHRLVDTLVEDDTVLIGLSALRSVRLEGNTVAPSHAVNVAVLSLVLGRAGGLGRGDLAELGLAALLHDVGTHAGALDDDALRADTLAAHAVRGAARLVRSAALDAIGTSALVALEHHLHAGDESAPRTASAWETSTATRIVQIADAYDHLRDAGEAGALPARGGREALAVMQRHAGSCFDPGWLARFVRLLGAYPPATVVQLDRGDIGVVVRANRDPCDFELPEVRLLLDPDGRPYTGEPTANLAAAAAPRIRTTVDPQSLGIDPVGLFLP